MPTVEKKSKATLVIKFPEIEYPRHESKFIICNKKLMEPAIIMSYKFEILCEIKDRRKY